jgi:hypothetical protein
MSDISEELHRDSMLPKHSSTNEFIDGEFTNLVQPELVSANTGNLSNRISAQELHKYVVGLFGVFLLFLITYPIAMNRVSQKEKFAPYQSHLKSLTPEYKSIDPQ